MTTPPDDTTPVTAEDRETASCQSGSNWQQAGRTATEDLPARMAAEMREHRLDERSDDEPGLTICVCGEQVVDFKAHWARVAMSVRWEDAVQLAARRAEAERRAEHAEKAATLNRERLDKARAVARQLGKRISIGQEGFNEIQRERDTLEREAERLRAELAEAREDFGALLSVATVVERNALRADVERVRKAVIDAYGEDYAGDDTAAEVERLIRHLVGIEADMRRLLGAKGEALEKAVAERDLLRETLAESDLGAQVLAQWEAGDAAVRRAEAAVAERDAAQLEVTEWAERTRAALERVGYAESEAKRLRDFFHAMAEQRDALNAAIERIRADCTDRLGYGQATAEQRIFSNGVRAQAERVLNILDSLDSPETSEAKDENRCAERDALKAELAEERPKLRFALDAAAELDRRAGQAERELAEARAAIERIRAEHKPVGPYCYHCDPSYGAGDGTDGNNPECTHKSRWCGACDSQPVHCRTLAALEAPAQATAEETTDEH